ncbi:MAG TPA: biopolymer transporter ExbD [Nitrospiria bacterium]
MNDPREQNRRYMAEINVVPLVDVVLVLLVIFMITAPLMTRGMDVDLPQSATNTIKPEKRVILTVSDDEKVFLDKEPVPIKALEAKLRELKERSPEVSIFLRGDRKVPYGVVVRVMDAVKSSGIEKLGMVTEPVSGSNRAGR